MTYDQASAALPHVKRANLLRALAILGTHPDDTQIGYKGDWIVFRDIELCILDEEDLEVLSVLMVSKEFGFALAQFEQAVDQLRALRKPWTALGTEFLRKTVASAA